MKAQGWEGRQVAQTGVRKDVPVVEDEGTGSLTTRDEQFKDAANGRGRHDGGRHGDGGRRGTARSPRRRRVLRWSATVLSVVILGTAGAGYLYYRHLNDNLETGRRSNGDSKAEKPQPNAAGQTPLNILVIGSDSRNSAANLKLGGSRSSVGSKPLADVQMLIHLSADRESASVVSIPRDTRVDIPECTDPETGDTHPATNRIINESLARGGAGCTLATWENLTGVYIDHWMMIDFAGVVSMADAVGGVEVCVEQNVWDRPLPGVPGGSGLKLESGRQKVQGKQALQWLRTRHAFYSDVGRAKAQHMYMNSMIRTLKQQNVFTDTTRLMDLAETATEALKVSEEIGTVKQLYDLAMQLKTVPTNRITMTTMPTKVDPQNANHLLPADADAEKIWSMIRDDVAFDKNGKATAKKPRNTDGSKEKASADPAADDAEIGVLVQNATRTDAEGAVDGRASALAGALVGKGFTRAAADTTIGLSAEKTVVRYPSAELEGDARRVAESLGIPASSVRRSTDVTGVTLVVGADWRSGTTYPEQAEPEAGDVPESAGAINGSDRSQCMDVYAPYRW
ncbi:LCP family protein [Streptomyces chromofuscus]|uniref:LCP family protein n=1 Tax=Streptomyces chromofuscus TaxID=42881 RepID=A0A7M2TFN2_STRCW|nr:LCP family protein [Streptomyces chromofuscus]QOV47014.1 LCP family protein [Streptomyces chromofuscus]GGT25690.1 transcriptional regulator [Streptomyces chromofuscus]